MTKRENIAPTMSRLARLPITFKRSPVVIVKTIVALELAAIVLFFAAKPLAFYKELYNFYLYRRLLPYEYDLVYYFSVGVFEILLTLYLFFRWYRESYRIDEGGIRHRSGLLIRRETTVQLADVRSVHFSQGLLGKLGKYGTVTLHLKGSPETVALKDVPYPKRCADIVLAIRRRFGDAAGDRDPSPDASAPPDIAALLRSNENEQVEFKSTLRWDVRAGRVNKDMERAIMKTVAAFLNSGGGHLVIGVDDGRQVVGLDLDYRTLQRQDADGFENHFTKVFRAVIGPEFRQFVKLHFHAHDGKELCAVRVFPAKQPAYWMSEGKEEFYIRTGNATTPLTFREAAAYIRTRWGRTF